MLFCNQATFTLFESSASEFKHIDSLCVHWHFFDAEDRALGASVSPLHQVMMQQEPIRGHFFKIVSDQKSKWIKMSVIPLHGATGSIELLVSSCEDVTIHKTDELRYQAMVNYDPLTKLPNRVLLSDRLSLAIAHARRKTTAVAVCMIDLDGFKEVNDTLGHEAGDEVLIEAAKRMRKVVRGDDTVARLGGDEFVIILVNLFKSEECAVTLYRLLNTLSQPYSVQGGQWARITASIGVSLYPDDRVEPEILLRHADVAMYKSKNSGKNKFSFFDVGSDQKVKANYKALSKIKQALQSGDFCLYYQPKLNVASNSVVELEALARWNHPLLGLISPGEFLPLIESDEELSAEFDYWVIREALAQLHIWRALGIPLKVCVNISPRQFKESHFMARVQELDALSECPGALLRHLELEIVETAAVENLGRSNSVIVECKRLGITFALDDFGTGYSSLMHLRELAIDTIKIDRLFVSGMLENSENMAIVQAMIALASAFDIAVTAEGAEHIEEVLSLMELGCDAIQGFAIARPMPAKEVAGFIATFTPDPRWKIASMSLPSKTDFELLLAATNHKYWMELVLSELERFPLEEAVLQGYTRECRFGFWLQRGRDAAYRKSSAFHHLVTLHRNLHEHVDHLAQRLTVEKRSILAQERLMLQSLSTELIEWLERMRKTVGIHRKEAYENERSKSIKEK